MTDLPASTRAKLLLREQARRGALAKAIDVALGRLFDRQRAIVDSPRKRVIGRAGRRSGKTVAAIGAALAAAKKFPGATIPVVERTLTCSAAVAFWKALLDFDVEHKLDIYFHHTSKLAVLPDGTSIQMVGADTLEQADKLRGQGYPLVIVDEAGTYRDHVLRYLIQDVVQPCLMGYDGALLMLGTPGPRKKGYWFEICHSAAWEQHHWTLLDNPELGRTKAQRTRAWREAQLAEILRANGWSADSTTYRREYLGEWVDATDELMYEFVRGRNTIAELPPAGLHPWRHGLSIDLGYNDPAAFSVTAARDGDPHVYVVRSYQMPGLIPSEVAAHVLELEAEFSFEFIVADTGGQGKPVVEEMVQRYHLPVLAAEKSRKRVFVEHMNGDWRRGKLLVVLADGANDQLIEDLEYLPWNADRTDAAGNFADHLPDSLLYGWRQWFNTAAELLAQHGPEEGTLEWATALEAAIEDEIDAQAMRADGAGADFLLDDE